jgi:hypothetical protein
MTIFPRSKPWLSLFLISSLSLYIELAVIRWLSAEIRLMAYYKNLMLLAAFVGLAIGFAMVGKDRDYRLRFPGFWAALVFLVILIGAVTAKYPLVYPGSADEVLWKTATNISFWVSLVGFVSLVLIFFLTSMFLFVPLGQMVGEEMALHPPIKAYIVNILASLTGIWIFSLVSFLGTPPVIWFGLALLGVGTYMFYLRLLKPYAVVIFLASLVGIGIFDHGAIWSSYNRLNLTPLFYERQEDGTKVPMGFLLDVQHTFFQTALDLRPQKIEEFRKQGSETGGSDVEDISYAYNLPFSLAPAGGRVLVVGAGMGNDLSAALRAGMGQIDAVEIDPVILDLGHKYHPEQPYSDPRVTAIVADARAFFSRAVDRYDLVVFGLLDSHTLLSGLSSVRLDSYVYTIDSFMQVKGLLKNGGHVSITFGTNDWMEERLGRMMGEVFGPQRVYVFRSINGTTFIAGDIDQTVLATSGLATWQSNPAFDYVPLATDDWPYLYLRTRTIPGGYWQALLLIALACLVVIGRSFPEALHPDWHFWLLGAAFLLVEFKSITELALLFGTTWFVNSLAISGVLVMALIANLYVLKRPGANLRWLYLLLFVSIAIGYLTPLDSFASLPAWLKAIASTVLLTLPLFFAGIIFSESLRRTGETARPLASNFSGSAVGGLLEYSSSLWGIKSMYLLAGLIYIGAFITALRPGWFKRTLK